MQTEFKRGQGRQVKGRCDLRSRMGHYCLCHEAMMTETKVSISYDRSREAQ